jgi:hypothetical protein
MGPAHILWRGFALCRKWAILRLLRRRRFVPDASLARLRHQEQAEHERDRGHGDRVDKRVGEAAGGGVGRRGYEWHQAAAPAVTDMIRHRD